MSMTAKPAKPIQFIDLAAQRERLGQKLMDRIAQVTTGGAYIMGPDVRQLEAELAAFSQAKYCLSCANGTDAIVLPLMAWGIGPGDAVFCPSFSFVATAEVIPWTGATPVFVDVLPDTYNLDPKHLEATIATTLAEGRLKPKAVIAVDLFGQPADYPAISKITQKYGLKLIADSAQGYGCTLDGKDPSYWADAVPTSFYPAKPLGCYGDGGAVVVNDERVFHVMDSLRVHGKVTKIDLEGAAFAHDPKYMNVRVGMNSRLDTIQAAILLEKLSIFKDEIVARNKVADRYGERLSNVVRTPRVITGGVSTWAQYTIETRNRPALAEHLKAAGVPTAVYYPIPIHKMVPYAHYPVGPGGLPVTEALSEKVISLPMHPYLTPDVQDYVIEQVILGETRAA
jgi:UDP-2-acetamido-2-deoxy-ribo-hexuluronate aminotransferase